MRREKQRSSTPSRAEHEEHLLPQGSTATERAGSLRSISVGGGRRLLATNVLDTYWKFAHERQATFMRRVANESPPWTADPIIAAHRFTNAYRASDRVSQYLIRHVIYEGDQAEEEVFFRTVLFKLFNRIDTWERLTAALGSPSWRNFKLPVYEKLLDSVMHDGHRVYSAAYIMPSPSFGADRKHGNHLRLLEHMMRDGAPNKITRSRSLEEAFKIMRAYPSLGDFLAFQLTIDLNYGPVLSFSEMDFVVAGPGAKDGLSKCFADTAGLSDADVIRAVAEMAADEFNRLELRFRDLWGRPLQLIDCQNIFCEVSKYARVAHPDVAGMSGRTKIKQRFVPESRPVPQWYPPKWGVHPPQLPDQRRPARTREPSQASLFS